MNALPESVLDRIAALTHSQSLKGEYAKLSDKYRHSHDKMVVGQKEHLTYLAARLPATYAVNLEVFTRLLEVVPAFLPKTLLDAGSGPGTTLLALSSMFTSIQEATLVEKDREFIDLSKLLLQELQMAKSWQATCPVDQQFDLVTSSYMLTELDDLPLQQMLKELIACSRSLIALIDTGTPAGYSTLMKARDFLIANGFAIMAPCPHQKACPMPWCHFSVRLPRSRLHRQVKEVERGFEDEKFCYLIAKRGTAQTTEKSRIVKLPMKRSGHVYVALCTPSGALEETVISKKTKERYTVAKKAEWGDLL